MPERLLNTKDVCSRLSISQAGFYNHRANLIARGLKVTRIGQVFKYSEKSLDELIKKLIDEGTEI